MRESLIAGQYTLTEQVGRGGFAVVWRARDERLGRDVAAKRLFLPPHHTEQERREHRARTFREARSAARLSHPSVVTVYDVVEDDGIPWIIMEYVTGRTLGQIVRTDGPLSPYRAAEVGRRLLSALSAAHAAGVLHRDVKPSNVMMGGGRVVLGDFGIAQAEGDSDLTGPGVVMGAPSYTAPERARGEPAVPASDLWSLGATLYYAVEGRRAFHGPNANATFHAVLTTEPPPPLHAGPLTPVIEGLLCKDAAARLTAEEAAVLLGAVRPGAVPVRAGRRRRPVHDRRPEATRPTRAVPAPPASSRRRPGVVVSLGAFALLLLFLPAGHALTVDDPRPAASYRVPAGPRLTATLPAGRSGAASVAFSPDGRLLATGGQDDAVRLWDLTAHRPAGTLSGHRRPVSTATFSPDGRILATGAYDGKVILWTTGGHRLGTLDTGNVGAVAFSADGTVLATAGDGVRLWHVTGRRRPRSPAGKSLLTAAVGPPGHAPARAARLWNAARPAAPATATGFSSAPAEIPGGLAFSPDGRVLATCIREAGGARGVGGAADLGGSTDGVRDVAVQRAMGGAADVGGAAGSEGGSPGSGGTCGAAAGAGRTSDNVGVAGGLCGVSGGAAEVGGACGGGAGVGGNSGNVSGASDSAGGVDGLRGASGVGRGMPGVGGNSTGMGGTSDSLGVAGGLCGVSGGAAEVGGACGGGAGVGASSGSMGGAPDSVGGAGGLRGVGGVRRGEAEVGGNSGSVGTSSDSVGGLRGAGGVAGVGGAFGVRLWDVGRRRVFATVPCPAGRVAAVAFSPDGHTVACAGGAGVLLWNTATRTPVARIDARTRTVRAVAFSPDGRTLATAGDDAAVRLWSLT